MMNIAGIVLAENLCTNTVSSSRLTKCATIIPNASFWVLDRSVPEIGSGSTPLKSWYRGG